MVEEIHIKAVADVSRSTRRRVFLFSLEILGGFSRKLLTLVKLYQKIYI